MTFTPKTQTGFPTIEFLGISLRSIITMNSGNHIPKMKIHISKASNFFSVSVHQDCVYVRQLGITLVKKVKFH